LGSVSFVIPWRERLDSPRVENCFSSLALQSVRPEVVLVDYGSGGHYGGAMRGLCGQYGWVYRRVETGDHWSYAIPANMGIRMASGAFIVCTGIDYLFAPNVAAVIESVASPDVLALCRARYLGEVPNGLNWGEFEVKASPHSDVNKSIVGAHRDWWFRARGYDERFRGWGEVDTDIENRAVVSGLRRVDIDGLGARIYHQPHGYQGHVHGKYDQIRIDAVSDWSVRKNDENWGTEQSAQFSRVAD